MLSLGMFERMRGWRGVIVEEVEGGEWAEEGVKGADGAFFLIDRVLSLRRQKEKKGAVGGPFGSLGVIFGRVAGG